MSDDAVEDPSALRVIEEHWNMTYQHAAGRSASHFYDVLERDGRLVGRRCPECTRVLIPPRSFCDRCFSATTDWADVEPTGKLEMFTVVYQKFQGLPEPPYAFGYVLLDGADTAILNFIRGVDVSEPEQVGRSLSVGAPMTAMFAADRRGLMADFWFEPGPEGESGP